MTMMKAIRVQLQSPDGTIYSPSNPAPSSAIHMVDDVPEPQALKPNELVVQIKAAAVVRDNLTWPELYGDPTAHLGNDFAGVVTEVPPGGSDSFKPGDKVYGMTHAKHGGAWADYALVTTDETYAKPASLSWEEAAALPMSALTADQALFEHAGLDREPGQGGPRRVLVTGAAGGVGMFVVQFAAITGHHVVAATSSNARNDAFLKSLGAAQSIEYSSLDSLDSCDVIIDTVGGDALRACWAAVKANGALISIDSASYDFVEEHRNDGVPGAEKEVRALFFVVEPTRESLKQVSKLVSEHGVKGVVAKTLPMRRACEAYDLAYSRDLGRGKIILTV